MTAPADIENFVRFFDPLPDAMLLISTEGVVGAANPAARALCGCAGAELRDRRLNQLVVDPPEKVERYLKLCARSRELIPGALTFRTASGGKLDCRIDGAVIRPRVDGTPAFILLRCRAKIQTTSQFIALNEKITALSHEISERRRAEAELYQQRESLRVTLSSIGDAVIATEGEGRVTFINPVAEQLTGWPQSEAMGKPLHEVFQIINEVTRTPCDNPVVLVLKHDQTVALANHTVLISRDGTEWPIEDSAAPIRDVNGYVLGVVLVFRDASQRRRQEDLREALLVRETLVREKAERANHLKDEFLATLSHELRTPLSAITGWVHLLLHQQLPPEQVTHGLGVIARNVRTQTQLINDLLDVSRILSGKLSLDFKPVNLESTIAAALDSVQLLASAKSISLRRHLHSDAFMVQGDPSRLQQVICNLLHNSIKFTPNGGWVEVRLERDDATVKLSVTDNGVGIAAEFLPYLFERFRQADSSSTRRHGGLGLGLALVRELTELQGGTVSADSPGVGLGTTVTICLPPRTAPLVKRKTTRPTADPELALPSGHRLPGLRILLVEDDQDSREIIRLALQSSGADVLEACSAAEAMEKLRQSVPDVLVSDIGLPDEDGFSLIRLIRKLPRAQGGSVPALALTAFARTTDAERALREGFNRHLAKPATPTDLIDAVASLTGTKTESSSDSRRVEEV